MRALFLFLIPVAFAADGDPSPAGNYLQAQAEPAIVELDPIPENQRYLRLPDLAFDLRVEPHCAGGASIRSVLISAADSRTTLENEDFEDSPAARSTLVVPRLQAGILRVDGFCREHGAAAETRRRIDGLFSARISLWCASEEQESVSYATLPLDVVLRCSTGQSPPTNEAATEISSP